MTEISFYFSAPNRTGYACRLVRQAQRQGMALAVTGPAAALAEFDRELWSFAAPEFVPHSPIERLAEVPTALHSTTVWLTADALAAPRHEALVNLGDEPPPVSKPSPVCSRSSRTTRATARRRARAGRPTSIAAIRSSVTR